MSVFKSSIIGPEVGNVSPLPCLILDTTDDVVLHNEHQLRELGERWACKDAGCDNTTSMQLGVAALVTWALDLRAPTLTAVISEIVASAYALSTTVPDNDCGSVSILNGLYIVFNDPENDKIIRDVVSSISLSVDTSLDDDILGYCICHNGHTIHAGAYDTHRDLIAAISKIFKPIVDAAKAKNMEQHRREDDTACIDDICKLSTIVG